MSLSNIHEIEKELESSKRRIVLLQKGYQAILQFIDKMEQFGQFQEKVDITSNISNIWQVFLEDIRSLIEVDVCALFLVDEDTHEFTLNSVVPQDEGAMCRKEMESQVECGMFPWVINRRQPAIMPSLVLNNEKTIIMVPLCTIKRTLGVVLVVTPIEESSITQEKLRLLRLLGKQFSLVIENTLLYENLEKEHISLQKAQDQILQAEKLASLGRLTAGAFHEILNPLNIISGHIQLMLLDEALDSRSSKYLNIMKGQSGRIEKIVKGLLQFSRYSKPKNKKIDINNIIEKTLSLLEYDAKFRTIQVIKSLEPGLPPIMGDGEKLSQVFFNVLSNIKDAMPDGGTCTISTSDPSKKEQLSEKTGFIEIKFQDTGCGIAKEDLDKVFDPFFTTKDAGKGTGLGLSLSYGIIKAHGGSLTVESTLNAGTVFTVILPMSEKKRIQ